MPVQSGVRGGRTFSRALKVVVPAAFGIALVLAGGGPVGAATSTISGAGGASAGSSHVVGGAGARTFVVKNTATGYWTLNGDGADTLDFVAVTAALNVNLNNTSSHQQVRPGLFLK